MSENSSLADSEPTGSTAIDATAISNAILFCQDSIALLDKGRKKLNPLGENPGVFDMADSMRQLQNSMLDLLNWAHQVNARLAAPSAE